MDANERHNALTAGQSLIRSHTIALGALEINRQINISGDFLCLWYAPGMESGDVLTVRMNGADQSPFTLRPGRKVRAPFNRLFVSIPAGLTGTAEFLYGAGDIDADNAEVESVPNVLEAIRDELTGNVTGEGFGAATVGVAAAVAVAANADRKGLHVQAGMGNAGTIVVGQGATVTLATGIQLVAGQSFWINDYRGPVWCIATGAGQRLNYFEV